MALAAGQRSAPHDCRRPDADLGKRLALSRIDLARHDGPSPGSFSRQRKLAEAERGQEPRQADVVGDLEERGGGGVDRAVAEDHRVVCGSASNLFRRGSEADAGDAAISSATFSGKPDGRVEPGADGGPRLGEFAKAGSVISIRLIEEATCAE